jgi:hypothetical protein
MGNGPSTADPPEFADEWDPADWETAEAVLAHVARVAAEGDCRQCVFVLQGDAPRAFVAWIDLRTNGVQYAEVTSASGDAADAVRALDPDAVATDASATAVEPCDRIWDKVLRHVSRGGSVAAADAATTAFTAAVLKR